MGKRKHKDKKDDNYIRRKIRKLKEKLEKNHKHDEDCDYESSPYSHIEEESISNILDEPTEAVLNESEPGDQPTPSLPVEILNILGEARIREMPLGDVVPNELSERWGKILLDGLAKEPKAALLEKMLIPENFLLARAPKLNPEVASVITDVVKNRDKRLEKSQNQLGSGIAGLVNLTKDLIKNDVGKLDIIKKISEVSQVLLDLHYEESINRRKLIMPLLDKNFWTIIQGVKRDDFLFGEKLGENIKNSKNIEKSSDLIKKPIPQFQRKAFTQPGNSRAPPRQQTNNRTAMALPQRYAAPVTRRTTNLPMQRNRQQTTNKTYDRRQRR